MISGVVLAAGVSSRLGVPKQLLAYRGRSLIVHVVENLLMSQVDEVVVVLGNRAEQVMEVLAGYSIRTIINREFTAGQSTSLKAGLTALSSATRAALFVLGDQPLVNAQTINLLIDHYWLAGGIVAPYFNGKRGNPVLFDRDFFKEISFLSGDVGAREIIRKHPESLVKVNVTDSGVVFDVDTWGDYHALISDVND
ncbi:MAG: Nicotine blue oxidoreductase [Pelotomaculum sp. PtaB.Bin013]|uniref:Molybdenum cofactor cytidylyltransferase n=1 Tax=Pelotomaculum isophthalicicum JI TaxID=947010 RepID=A0A9X4JV66_9FIRM|nr:molybdenum cofactor cytidylyltransferase [Pelotomaculum isophthalicicum]MDF9406852.1 molybdenum cofactor cytidylyltransferase [Pelotomaculum isophthalicicum JI]OPX81412.1 MAG: Nicotine blue oxidoreductase [Pelotomaculum sp. PtaB.Bin013]